MDKYNNGKFAQGHQKVSGVVVVWSSLTLVKQLFFFHFISP
jgi:hypothetical protein